MSYSYVKANSRMNTLSLAAPALIVLTVLALVVKESPFYIDLSATAILGLLVASRFYMKGLLLATGILGVVLGYNFFFDQVSLTLWEIGLSASLECSFVIAALAQAEFKEVFQQACYLAGRDSHLLLEKWKEETKEALGAKDLLAEQVEELKGKMLLLQDAIKVKTETSEMFERLLEMARNEMREEAKQREHFQNQYFNERIEVRKLTESLEEIPLMHALNQRLEKELQDAHTEGFKIQSQLHDKNLRWMDAELKCQALQEKMDEQLLLARNEYERLQGIAGEKEGKLQALGEKLEALIDQLKDLQKEKDELEKALEGALAPAENADQTTKEARELRRVWGLHNQLRSQFEEKSLALNQTRKELFQTEEKLFTLQRSVDENYVFDDETVKCFEAYILQLSAIIEDLELELDLYRTL